MLEKGTTLANHLSRNSGLHEYKETEEEVLITVLKKVKAVYDTSPHVKRNALAIEHLLDVRTHQEKNARLHKVMHHENMCMFLGMRLLCLGPHFRHRREFMVNWLAKNMDVCMGVSSFACVLEEGTVRSPIKRYICNGVRRARTFIRH